MSNTVHKYMTSSISVNLTNGSDALKNSISAAGLNLVFLSTSTSTTSTYNDGDKQQQQQHNNDSDAFNLLMTSGATESTDNAFSLATSLAVTLLSTTTNETFYDYSQLGLGNFTNYSCDGEMQLGSLANSTEFEEEESALSSVYFKALVYLLYIPTFVFALLGNGIVCYIVQSTPRMRTVTNYFIANLAVGDILMSLFCVPFSFVSIFILMYWPFGIVFCYLVNFSQAVSVLVSAYTLVAISIDRYIAIMWPLRPRITKRYAKFIIGAVWSIALITAFPIPIVSKLIQPDPGYVYCNRYICREEWPSMEQNYYYTLALFTLQFVVPLSVLVFTYTRIALAVWGKRPPGEAENTRDQRMARSKRKVSVKTQPNLNFVIKFYYLEI